MGIDGAKVRVAGLQRGQLPRARARTHRGRWITKGRMALLCHSLFRADRSQVSGYIDYGHRLATESWEAVFEQRKRLMPKPGDLSYYNWDTRTCTSDATQNFQVRADARTGRRAS